jgi:2-polyprenyl-6-methoxyphenol hydroxylase-like FAD-dependent oxidoreductase
MNFRSKAVNGRVLVSGAGIAGPALAYWLQRFGFQATLVERAATLRPGGQAIDVRGVAVEVLKNMGLYEASCARRTHMRGGSVLDADGNEVWRSEERSFSGGRFDSGDVELFRDDLIRLLYEATRGASEYLWDDSISAIEQSPHAVRVTFERERPRDFDLLVGADGLHSHVRRLVFGDEAAHMQSFGIGIAIFSTPNLLQLRDWQFSHRDTASGYVLYPNLDNSELRVNLGFALRSPNEWCGAVSAQKALVAERCAHMRWQIPRLLEAMRNSSDFYFGDIAQVKMPGWSSGRAVLLGDAAYCPSPFSGQGTGLALVGAYMLARELQRTPADLSAAFQRYESRMRPYVELNQALVDLDRTGPIPDDIMNTAKNGITFDEGDIVGLRPIKGADPFPADPDIAAYS